MSELEHIYSEQQPAIIMTETEKREAQIHAQGTSFEFAYLKWLFESPLYQARIEKVLKNRQEELKTAGKVFQEDTEKRRIRNQMNIEWNEIYGEIFRSRWNQDEAFRDQAMEAVAMGVQEREDFFKKVEAWFSQEQQKTSH